MKKSLSYLSCFSWLKNKMFKMFIQTNTFTQLADETTKLYEKPWEEIYGMPKEELQQ